MWVDSHCHMNDARYGANPDVPGMMARARAAGVTGAVTVCCKIADDYPGIADLARRTPNLWCTIGTHPHEAGRDDEKAVSENDLVKQVAANDRIVAVGETGLDYFYQHSTPPDQHESFRKHIRAAARAGVPLVIHARDADDDLIRILREEGAGINPAVRGVMHCFSGTRWLCEQALEIGFYISFSGILTFKKSDDLRAIARDVPMDRLLVETDAPYLAPEPHRGAVNEPAMVVHTAKVLADLKGVSPGDLASATTRNFYRLFNRAEGVFNK